MVNRTRRFAKTGPSKSDIYRELKEAARTRKARKLRESLKRGSKRTVRESSRPLNDINVVIENFKKYKEAVTGNGRASYKEIKKLRESVARANRLGRKLHEADENFVDNQDPNAAAATGAVSPDVQTQIQGLLSQVQALAASAGVQLNDFDADPNANIPPVEGQPQGQAVDATQQAVDQPMLEAVRQYRAKYGKVTEAAMVQIKKSLRKKMSESEALSDRIMMRQAKLDMLDESFRGDFADAYFARIYEKKGETAESPITSAPTTQQLISGYSSGPASKSMKPADRWPTKEYKDAPLQGAGVKQKGKVKESVEIEESVTQKYLDNYFSEKLDFTNLKEAMSKGILG